MVNEEKDDEMARAALDGEGQRRSPGLLLVPALLFALMLGITLVVGLGRYYQRSFDSEILAVVDGIELDRDRLARHLGRQATFGSPADARAALEALIDHELMEKARHGLRPRSTPLTVDELIRFMAGRPVPGEEELRAFHAEEGRFAGTFEEDRPRVETAYFSEMKKRERADAILRLRRQTAIQVIEENLAGLVAPRG